MDDKFIYDVVIGAAKRSPCLKRRFGCIAVHMGLVIATDCNRTIEPLAHICKPGSCIRFSIDSGTDSLLGACGHAEERVIWRVVKQGYADGVELYVAGYNPDPSGKVYNKKEPFFYCLRCAIAMYYAGIEGVHVWVQDHFHFMTVPEALDSASQFALGLRQVDDLV